MSVMKGSTGRQEVGHKDEWGAGAGRKEGRNWYLLTPTIRPVLCFRPIT